MFDAGENEQINDDFWMKVQHHFLPLIKYINLIDKAIGCKIKNEKSLGYSLLITSPHIYTINLMWDFV